ncbi:hypothetical protein BAUCODRAFT_149161 [Baudoinia panamericana UAMH 10762]|uniref:AB hydrolase-1 domain-containing protein n=1 Tax=Baudoinia panamericana (strain UAMH 10762) TaxID=717646 RepID=M2MU96_BAUPA|nr:uncharacterized protein BAUCODRAFT_149161 [Baudoinia panamericana UAMH 10762]EMC95138.1 hypothetical protein BAUCODRAFT_149161 [Baudoinia panamericana UAMH 10762]
MDVFTTTTTHSRRTLAIPATYPRRAGTVAHERDELKIALHDYRVHQHRQHEPITLLFAHGTSFSKDLWDLIIRYLLSDQQLAGRIKRIVAIDASNHGDSAVLNAGKLGTNAFWPDNAYDILTVTQTLGLSLPLVGIGHSFGGGTLAHAAVISPGTFSATIFVEPILFIMPEQDGVTASVALRRKDQWRSLDDVCARFEKSQGLADWHPEQRKVYAEKGTSEATGPDGQNKRILKTPKAQEAATYIAAPYPGILEMLHNSCGQHTFILGGSSKVMSPDQRQHIGGLMPRSTIMINMPDAGHLIPMTHPLELARHLREQLLRFDAPVSKL